MREQTDAPMEKLFGGGVVVERVKQRNNQMANIGTQLDLSEMDVVYKRRGDRRWDVGDEGSEEGNKVGEKRREEKKKKMQQNKKVG